MKKENKILKEDNARLKSIINNDSSNISLPPSSDNKNRKPANTYNGRKKQNVRQEAKKGIREQRLQKQKLKKK